MAEFNLWDKAAHLLSSGTFSAALTFFFGAASFVFYFLGQKKRKPYYLIKSVNLIKGFQNTFEYLKLTHAEKLVENVTISKIFFWNAGSGLIRSEDVASRDPIGVKLKNDLIMLEPPKLLGHLNPANGFALSYPTGTVDYSEVGCTFDYLAKNDGFALEVIHNGISTEDITVKGTVKGHNVRNSRTTRYAPIVICVILSMLFFISFFLFCVERIEKSKMEDMKRLKSIYHDGIGKFTESLRNGEELVAKTPKHIRQVLPKETKQKMEQTMQLLKKTINEARLGEREMDKKIKAAEEQGSIMPTAMEVIKDEWVSVIVILFLFLCVGFIGGFIFQALTKPRLPAPLRSFGQFG